MRELTSYSLAADAELARAELEAAGIECRVADFSAMQEMADHRLMVDPARLADATLILGVPAPDPPVGAPGWTGWVAGVVGVIVVIGLLLALFT